MRMSRRQGLIGGKLPTFAELFSSRFYRSQIGAGYSSEAAITYPFGRYDFYSYDDWFLFFSAGGSLEISRIKGDKSTNVLTSKTTVRHVIDGNQNKASALNAAGTAIVSDNVYAGNMTLMAFWDYDHSVVEAMFKKASYSKYVSYYGPDLISVGQNSICWESKSAIMADDGVIFASYYDVPADAEHCSIFNIANAKTPLTTIANGRSPDKNTADENPLGYLREDMIGGSSYIAPRTSVPENINTGYARLNSYALWLFHETW